MPSGPKPGSTPRRVSSSLSKVATPSSTTNAAAPARTTKTSSNPSKIIHLHLPKTKLLKFPHEQILRKSTQAKASPLSSSKVISPDEPTTDAAVKQEPDPTSARGKDSASPTKDTKPEKPVNPKVGVKRELGSGVEGEDSDKLKSNPRKRPRTDPSKPDGRTAAAKAMNRAAGITAASHKLGPKANQGVINEKLRALDRTGKPCRKWGKTGFRVKSFTGRVWEISSWRSPMGRAFGSEGEQASSNSQSKENSVDNVGSDKSPGMNASNVASSPVNGVSTPA